MHVEYWFGDPDFNPRSREGSDLTASLRHTFCMYFNPRSREGSDAIFIRLITQKENFNPRSREGSDFTRTYSSTS